MALNLPPSAQKVADSYDMLFEILVLLPTKTLLKLQLVSKHWQSLILSDHHFSRLHTRRPRPRPTFILRSSPADAYFHFNPLGRSFEPLFFPSPYTKILQSCNGLLLLESRNTQYSKKQYSVYNPVTKRSRSLSITISDDDNEEKKSSLNGISLAFDPSRSLHFKIVCVVARKGEKQRYPDYVIKVYESEFDTWSDMGALFPDPAFHTTFVNGFYCNNRVYWIRPTATSFYFDLGEGHVRRVSTKIGAPSRRNGEIHKKYIMESNGHVHCLAIYVGQDRKSLVVFELSEDNTEDDNDSWFRLCSVNLKPVARVLPEMDNVDVNVLGIVRGETVRDSFVLIHVPGKVVCYRFDGGQLIQHGFTTCKFYTAGKLQFGRYDSFQFVGSLAPV